MSPVVPCSGEEGREKASGLAGDANLRGTAAEVARDWRARAAVSHGWLGVWWLFSITVLR